MKVRVVVQVFQIWYDAIIFCWKEQWKQYLSLLAFHLVSAVADTSTRFQNTREMYRLSPMAARLWILEKALYSISQWVRFVLCRVLVWFGNCNFDPNPWGLLHCYWGNHMMSSAQVMLPGTVWINYLLNINILCKHQLREARVNVFM